MSVMLLRADVKPDKVAEVEAAAKTMFAAIQDAGPTGVRYASCRVGESTTFVILLQVEDGAENPLLAVPEFRQFQESIGSWLAGPPTPEQLTVVGSYNLFS